MSETLTDKKAVNLSETTDLSGLFTDMETPDLPPELEKSIGIAIEKMTDPSSALTLGELNLLERKCLTALYMKYRVFNRPIYRAYLSDYVTRTSAYNRKRAGEMVEILKAIQQFKRVTFGQRIKDALKL